MITLPVDQLTERFVGSRVGPPNTISEGPFHVTHNGVETFGTHLVQQETIVFFDGGRVIEIDENYTIDISGDVVTFINEAINSHIVLRPIEMGDIKILPQLNASTVEELEDAVYLGLLQNGLTGDETKYYMPAEKTIIAAAPAPEDLVPEAFFGITVDEDGTVLELVKTDASGTYVRENETWVALDPDADEEENPTVYGMDWYDVSVDIIPVYDDSAESDQTLLDFETFIVP